MRAKFRNILAAVMVAAASFSLQAQTNYATVSGTVTDPSSNPYAYAAYQFTLVDAFGNPVQSRLTPNGQAFVAKLVTGFLDSTGHFSVQLQRTDGLMGPATFWHFNVSAPTDAAILTYGPAWTLNYTVAITGNVDLSSQLSTQARTIAFLNLKTSQSTITGSGGLPAGCTGSTGGVISCAGAATFGSFAGAGTGLTGTASGLTVGHANNLPADFATQSAASAQAGSFTTLAATTLTAGTSSAQNLASIGPRFDVTQFGAVGDGSHDDTSAIQAAFNACALGQQGAGAGKDGFVTFPGKHSYLVTSTIYAYDSCAIEGTRGRLGAGATGGATSPPQIYTNLPNVDSNTASVTAATIINNHTQTTPVRTAMDPSYLGNTQLALYQITITATNTFAADQWVGLSGCTYAGLNNVVGQVYSATGSSFILLYNGNLTTGTYGSETCTATQTNVVFAFDSLEHEVDTVSDLKFQNKLTGGVANWPEGIDLYFSGRADAGMHISDVWTDSCHLFCHYFAEGAEEIKFDNGSRSNWTDGYQIYVRDDGIGGLVSVTNGQWGSGGTPTTGATANKGGIMVDNGSCNGGLEQINIDHVVFENDGRAMAAGYANITMIDCPAQNLSLGPQFQLDIRSSLVASGFASNIIQVTPANDLSASIHISSSLLNPGGGVIISGIPSVGAMAMQGTTGNFSEFNYAPALTSWGRTDTKALQQLTPLQAYADLNIHNLYQWNQYASPFLETATDFSSLSSGRTLLKGQVIASPNYFQCGTGTGCNRYAFQVVQSTGTVGTLNAGATTCTAPGGTVIMTCSSATGLSAGQMFVLAGSGTVYRIKYIDATNPTAVAVTATGNIAAATNAVVSYSPPVLGSELQLITKSAAAPTTGTCVQGDFIESSVAAANGVMGWSCTTAGSPGTWTPVYSGVASGTTTVNGVPCALGGSCSVPGVQILCRITAPIINTVTPAQQQVFSCTIPAGTVGATGTMQLIASGAGCSALNVPYSGGSCGAANTGTCQLSMFLSTTNASQTMGLNPSYFATAAKAFTLRANIQMQNSTGAEWVDSSVNYTTNATLTATGSGTVDMTGTTYLNGFMTNSAAGACGANQILLTYTP